MDEEVRQAIFEMRDSLIEMRDILRAQKKAQEQAVRESRSAKAALAMIMTALPPNIRSAMDPLTKTES